MVETQRVPTNITTWQQQPLSGFQKLDQGYIAPQQQQWGYSNQTQQQMTPLQETLIARATIIDETTPSIRRYVYEKDIVTIPRITEIHEQPIREIHEQPVYRTVYKPNPVLINVQDQKTVETVMSEKPIVSTQTYQEGSWSSTKASDDSYLLNLDLMNREPYINQDYYNYLGGVLGTSQEGLGFHRALAPPSESFIFQKSTQQPFVRGGEGFIQRGGAVPPPPGPMPQNYRPKSHRVPIPPGPMPSDYQPRISTYSERIFTGYQRPSLSQRLKELKKRDTFAQKPFFETRERGFIQQGVPPPPGPMPLDYHSKIPTESGILHSDKLLPDQLCYTSEKAPTATLYAQKTSDEQEKKVFSHLKLKSDELCYSSSERERTEKKREFENLPIIRPEQHIIDVVDVPEAPKEMPTDYTTRMPSVLESTWEKSKTQTVLAQPTPSIAPAVLLTKKQKKAKKKAEKKQKKKAISSKNVPAFPGPMPSNFKYRIPTDI